MKCGFCGKEFRVEDARSGCSGCAMSGHCGKISCPYCGYEMPAPLKAPGLGWLRRLIRAGRMCREATQYCAAHDGSSYCTLARLKKGETAEITNIDTSDPGRLRRFLALGVLPGARVRIVQTYPSHVFEIGYTSVAVDESTARAITVRKSA